MEYYHKRERLSEEKYGKLINLKPYNDDVGIADNKQQKYVKQLQYISDEEGLNRAYNTKDGLYQHYNKLFIAGTKDPIDMVDDLKLPFDDTLSQRGVVMQMLIIGLTTKLILLSVTVWVPLWHYH